MGLERVQKRAAFEPPLVNHVGDVIPLRSDKEMSRIATSGHIAMVTHTQPVWDWTVNFFPRQTMNFQCLLINPDLSIAIFIDRSGPEPTTPRLFFNTLPPW
jgi:hypothetical protein